MLWSNVSIGLIEDTARFEVFLLRLLKFCLGELLPIHFLLKIHHWQSFGGLVLLGLVLLSLEWLYITLNVYSYTL
jgi:hypothetical protein